MAKTLTRYSLAATSEAGVAVVESVVVDVVVQKVVFDQHPGLQNARQPRRNECAHARWQG